jgi:hypothetical protein
VVAGRLNALLDGIATRYSAFAPSLFALREAPLPGESSDATAARSRAIGHAIHEAKKAAVAGLQQLLQEHADAAQGVGSGVGGAGPAVSVSPPGSGAGWLTSSSGLPRSKQAAALQPMR